MQAIWIVRRMLARQRRTVAMIVYCVITAVAYYFAYTARFQLVWPSAFVPVFLWTLPILLLIRTVTHLTFRITTGQWRFVSTGDVTRLAKSTVTGTVVFFIVTRFLPFDTPVPISVVVLEGVLTGYLTAGTWVAYRVLYEQLRHRRAGGRENAKRVLIVGAGEAGNLLAREMLRFPTGYLPIGFVDDDPPKLGSSLHGLPVFGSVDELPRITRTHEPDEIILAVPSADPADMRRLVERCEATSLSFKILPGIAQVLEGKVGLHQLRDVKIEDLLGRDPVKLELPELAGDLNGRTVLITGAAGSIGSELSRQIALHEPSRLILFDQAETALFYLMSELRENHASVDIVTVVGDIVDEWAIDSVFCTHRPDRVFHAAAYKHVPMMEMNPREAVRNNVFGTWRVAEAAGRHKSGKFVLVSTDKAVNPANVMGATKRLAELLILELQAKFPDVVYSAVRFGNVLGSQGSVIPIFRRQLAEGKPLTVTHPDVTRYFMTIPEAVQLILQASVLPATRGQIVMLDMGEPVRILNLAQDLLRLSGVHGRSGSRIVFTGLRQGEKLHEELTADEEETQPTEVGKIRIVAQRSGYDASVLDRVDRLASLLEDAAKGSTLDQLYELFPSLRRSDTPAVA